MATVNEKVAAESLGWSVRTLQDKRYRGGGPPYTKIGRGRAGRVVYETEDLDAFKAARRRTSTSDRGPPANCAA
jgi:hypothetical protein